MVPRQFLAAVNKVFRLKLAHWVETLLEILLPVGFLALLLLFKGLADGALHTAGVVSIVLRELFTTMMLLLLLVLEQITTRPTSLITVATYVCFCSSARCVCAFSAPLTGIVDTFAGVAADVSLVWHDTHSGYTSVGTSARTMCIEARYMYCFIILSVRSQKRCFGFSPSHSR